MKIVEVAAGKPYPVYIGGGLNDRAGVLAALRYSPRKLALVMDRNVASLFGARAEASFSAAGFRVEKYVFEPGEDSKSFEELSRLLEFLAEREYGRNDLLAALGGGVTGDLTGFAASVYQRGCEYIQLPTTLLAAVDSSVGGKTAVNMRAGKNLAGAFWQPSLVICDCDAFATLPARELSCGAAECVKYSMIGNPALLGLLAGDAVPLRWEEIVERCVIQKAAVVALDERDTDARQILNFGHTIGHAIEHLSKFKVLHGEAVAMGMMVMTRAAEQMGFCAPGISSALAGALSAFDLPTDCPYPADALASHAFTDKKRRGDEITLILPRAVGECELYPATVNELREIIRMGLGE